MRLPKFLCQVIIVLLLLGFGFFVNVFSSHNSAEAAAPSLPSSHLFPTIKTWGNVGGGSSISDMATHYDWLTSSNPSEGSTDDYKTINPNMVLDQYFVWNNLTFVADYESGSKPGILAKWYDWNVKNGSDYEAAFYHANKNVTINQTYDMWGDWTTWKFRYLFRNNLPSTTYGNVTGLYGDPAFQGTASIGIGNSGDSLYFGQLDRFDQINLEFSTMPPSSGWQYSWQYSTGQGTWANLPISSSIWNGNKWTINFSPPPTVNQWKRTQVNSLPSYWGSEGIYFVKLTVNSGSSAVVNKAYGRNYRNATSGAAGATVPGWDPANDHDSDGYAESNTNPNATAKFKYEARIPDSWSWGVSITNVNNTAFQQKCSEFTVDTINAANSSTTGNRYIGAMIDTADGETQRWNISFDPGGNTVEFPNITNKTDFFNQWQSDWINFLSTGHVILNNAGYLLGGNVGFANVDGVNNQLDFQLREGYKHFQSDGCSTSCWENDRLPATAPMIKWGDQGRVQLFNWMLYLYNRTGDQLKGMNLTQNSTNVTSSGTHWMQTVQSGSWITTNVNNVNYYVEVDHVVSDNQLILKTPWPNASVGTSAFSYVISTQDKMAGLTAFMVLQKPDTDYFEMWFENYYLGGPAKYLNRIPAAEKDYGQPTGIVPAGKTAKGTRGAYLFAQGTDPTTSYAPYSVYARDYSKALVLTRPLTTNGGYLDSAVTISLPADDTWYPMDYFGNISSSPITSVSLQNVDGIILMKGSAMTGVTLTKSVDKTSALSGDVINYTIQYTVGSQNANNMKIEDDIPNGTTFVSAQNSGNYSSGKVVWDLGNLNSGSTGTVSFQVRIQ